MPEPDFYVKQNDTASIIRDRLLDADENPVDISGATVHFHMGPIGPGAVVIDQVASNDQSTSGTGYVSYAWRTVSGTPETSEPGLYIGEWEVTYTSGTVQTFPNGGYVLVKIEDDLA